MKAFEFNIDFMGKRKLFAGLSIAFVVYALFDLFYYGLNLGLDFTGGTLVEVQFESRQEPEQVRQVLERSGFRGGVVQYFGSERDLLVRMPPQEEGDQSRMGDEILEVLRGQYGDVVLKQASFVGPVVGEELRDDAGLAILAALGVVMVYILFRFTKHFAVAAVLALIHDVVVVVGIFSLFRWTFDLSVLAAVLAVIGYSLNDSIVVADRIRENFRLMRRASPVDVVNRSLNQIMSRTLVTSLTTLLVLVALLIAGGEMIRGFALALTIGIVFGTYSSIFVVASLVIFMKMTREDLIAPVEQEDAEGS
ncbi:MAG: protein translocase subunit SecF [Pseudomonadales bacterium]|nr:protein translocase subunit SecF [Pseudomonadales bacterium]